MIQKYIGMRWNQGIRIVLSVGILRTLFLFFIIIGIVFLFYKSIDTYFYYYIPIAFILFLLYIQLTRQDKLFLKAISSTYSIVFFIDYFLLSTPFLICMIIQQQVLLFIVLIGILIGISFLNFHFFKFERYMKKPFFILSTNIEWIAGYRKSIILFFIFYTMSFVLSFLQYGFLVGIILFIAIVSTFFDYGEPLSMLLAKEYSAQKFIRWKVLSHVKQYVLLTFPWLIIGCIFYFDIALIYISFYIYTILINICIVLTKYASYEPASRGITSFKIGLLIVCLFIPFLIPIPLFFSIRDYRKSIQNLDFFLYDYR